MSKILNMLMAFVMSFGISGSNVNPSDIPENSNFEVHFIDVGQADSALIECDGETMMIVGGLSGALSVTKADNIYAPKTEANTKAYKNFKKKAEKQNVEIKHPNVGDEIQLGSSTVEFLGPVDENGKDLNSTSIVLKITYGNTSFLFTGDAESNEEEEILNSGADLKSTVLKVGHHGSRTSTSYPFLREVMPQYAVISVEKGNSYGHPNEETLSKLSDAGVEVYRTDESGDIVMTSDGNSISITTSK